MHRFQKQDLPARHDLELLKQTVGARTYRFAGNLTNRTRQYLGDVSVRACEDRIRKVVGQLGSQDFAEVSYWKPPKGQLVVADVYGFADEYFGGWYVKFSTEGRVRLFSCHPIERNLSLKDGRTLKVLR